MNAPLMLAGALLLASDPMSSIEGSSEVSMIKVADYVTPALKRVKRSRVYYRYTSLPYYPVACEAVRFPRSPLCAGRPYRPSYYDYDYYYW
jgi:hypothetical protein